MTTSVKRISSAIFCASVILQDVFVWAAPQVIESKGMTLWEVIVSGGMIMVVLGALSVVAVGLVIYNFMTLKSAKLAPKDFAEKLIEKLERGGANEARKLCGSSDCPMSQMTILGLDKKAKGATISREAMESFVQREVGKVWQNLGYLSDIAAIAPLLGLLGTVVGMIQAFNAITLQASATKPILLAAGISKAMVTTAGGLFVAIPVMMFFAYFKGTAQDIISDIESQAGDLIKLIEKL